MLLIDDYDNGVEDDCAQKVLKKEKGNEKRTGECRREEI